MKSPRSIREVKSQLLRSILAGWVILSLAAIFSYGILFNRISTQASSMDQRTLRSAVETEFQNYIQIIAVGASAQPIIDYVRSGNLTQARLRSDVLDSLSKLKLDWVLGVKLSGSNFSEQVGNPSNFYMDFPLCYIGQSLDAQLGRCLATLTVYVNPSKLTDAVNTRLQGSLLPCNNCEGIYLSQNTMPSSQYLTLGKSNVNLLVSPPETKHWHLHLLLALAILVIGMSAMWTYFKLHTVLMRDVVEPLSDLANNKKTNHKFTLTELAKIGRRSAMQEGLARTAQMMAHDIRKPFTSVKMLLKKINCTTESKETHEFTRMAQKSIEQHIDSVNAMLEDIMSFDSSAQYQFSNDNLVSVIREVAESHSQLNPQKNVDISYDLPKEHFTHFDTNKLKRAFGNIIQNAIEASPANGVIYITGHILEAKGKSDFLVSISNQGKITGSLNLIFEAFYTRDKKNGTGLGLAIAKTHIEAHQGNIWCEQLKEPTVFYISLPLETKSRAPTLQKASPETARPFKQKSIRKVAIIEDDPFCREVWVSHLTRLGVETLDFDCPSSFIAFMNLQTKNWIDSFHAIILDQYFTNDLDMTGLGLASDIRKLYSGIIALATECETIDQNLIDSIDILLPKTPDKEWSTLLVSPGRLS